MSYTKEDFEQGQMFMIDKPFRWIFFDVVQKLRGILKIRKIGYVGILDLLVIGLLIICIGKFMKKINEYMVQEKEYMGTFTLGAITLIYDLESESGNFKPFESITEEQLKTATKKFMGDIQQVPSAHSAIKVGGKRVYELVRQGLEVKLELRNVTIKAFDIVKVELLVIHFRVVCITGIYIRSLANDYGEALQCGAHLSSLCRTRIGEFLVKDADTMESFREKIQASL